MLNSQSSFYTFCFDCYVQLCQLLLSYHSIIDTQFSFELVHILTTAGVIEHAQECWCLSCKIQRKSRYPVTEDTTVVCIASCFFLLSNSLNLEPGRNRFLQAETQHWLKASESMQIWDVSSMNYRIRVSSRCKCKPALHSAMDASSRISSSPLWSTGTTQRGRLIISSNRANSMCGNSTSWSSADVAATPSAPTSLVELENKNNSQIYWQD